MAKQLTAGVGQVTSVRALVTLAVGALMWGCGGDAAIPTQVPELANSQANPSLVGGAVQAGRVIPGQYIVTFADSVSDVPGLAIMIAARSGESPLYIYTDAVQGFAARLPDQAIEGLSHNPLIASIEPDLEVERNDVQASAPWHLDRIDQSLLPLDGSFVYSGTGAGVNIYIIDSGIRRTHREFGDRAFGAYTAVNDGRGTDDCTGHGTMVASAAAGTTFGVAKNATVWAVRVLDCSGNGATSGIIAGVDWVTKNARRPAVANMSLGGTLSSTLSAAVANSIASGVTYAVSAGNSATDACTQSPADVTGALTVASTTNTDSQASWSNFGKCVDVYAPGINILAAWNSSDTTTTRASGTSLSSPLVAGAAALYLEARPTAAPTEVAQAITSIATAGAVKSLGVGSPNLLLFTSALLSVPPIIAPADTGPATPGGTSTPSIDQPPVANLTVSCNKGSCTFDGSRSSDDAAITSYVWNFGDGSPSLTGITTSVKHVYTTRGSFSASVMVSDGSGQTSTARISVQIKRI